MGVNKIVYGGQTKLDISNDTVTPSALLEGYTAHDNTGALIVGTASGGGEGGNVWQDANGYLHLDDESGIDLQTKSVTPTETAQSVTPDAGYYALEKVNVGAISSSYVGSGITRRSSSDLTASGATVTAPSGYYSASASKSVASGNAGTPTATKGTVSNHSVTVTPRVTNTTGYITGGTINGTGVSVSASELVSGNKSITANGTNIDVANYSTVSVAIESATGDYMAKATKSGTIVFTIQIGSGSRTNITDGAKYFFNSGDTITVRVVDGGSVYYNGTQVAYNVQSTVSYSFTAPSNHLNIACSSDRIDINVTLVPSGTKSITENGTGIDVTNYASVNVAVSGGSSYTLIASTEYTVSTSSTTAITLADFDTGDTSIWTSDKMVYVKIRDKAGRRNGYYYGSDSFIINLIKGNGLTATSSYQITGSSFYQNANGYLQQVTLYRSSSSAVTGYGIYPTYVRNDGGIPLNARYSTSSYPTGTIDGTFIVEVYLLDFPNGISLFDE